jgi:HAD superfamily hydrolase (TIGR01662 family)
MIIKGIIFDLDQTLVDTRPVEQFRDERNWNKAIRNLPRTSVYPGIPEIIGKLISIDVKCGIVTSSPRKYAESVVSHHDLRIPVLVAYQDTHKHKPHPQPIIRAMELLDIDPQDVIAVGDNESDVLAANAAGVRAVLSGWSSAPELAPMYSQIIIESPSQLEKFF